MADDLRVNGVTYVINARLPTEKAHGLQVVRMCDAFARLDVAVHLLHPRRRGTSELADIDPLDYYDASTRFPVHEIGNVDVVAAEPWLPGPVFTGLHYLHGRLWAAYAARVATRLRPRDLFVARDIPVAWALVRRGVPTVLELHQAPARRSLALLRRTATDINLRATVTMTAALRETLAARAVDVSTATVLHDAVDLSRFAGAPARPSADPRPRVLYTGQLFREKGIDTLVDAAGHLGSGVEVVVAGGMPADVAHWSARIARDGPGNVTLLGHLPPSGMPGLQKGADILVLPNSGRHPHSARYSSPLKIFEYMAAGRPIVASDVPAIREILTDGVNAVLVPADDGAALASAITALISEPARGARLAGRALADVQTLTWEHRARAILRASRVTVPTLRPEPAPC